MTSLYGVLTLTLGISLVACEVTPQDYVELVEGARECSADGDCVLAGEGGCTCASPVNAASREEVDESAADLDCWYVGTTMCPATDNLRCEASRCVTDGNP